MKGEVEPWGGGDRTQLFTGDQANVQMEVTGIGGHRKKESELERPQRIRDSIKRNE